MSVVRVSKQYAKGLWLYVSQNNEKETIYQELIQVTQLIDESGEFRAFLKNPIIDSRKKISIMKEIFKNFSLTFKKFMEICVKARRENLLKEIFGAYINIYEENKGIVRVNIITAERFDQEVINQIMAKHNLSTNDIIKEKINSKIIGGYIIEKDQELIDASIRTQLNRMRNSFKQ